MKFVSVVSAAALFVVVGIGGPAFAADAEGKDDSKRLVCKRVKETGTHFRRRVCLTKETWEEMREEAQEDMRRVGPERSPQSG